VGVLRTLIAALVIALVPTAAWAQKVTNVTDGNTLVVEGVGNVRLLGIRNTDPSALQMGPHGPPPQPRNGPDTPPPTAVGGRIALGRERPSRDLLRKLALGKTVRIEYDPSAGSSGPRTAYLYLEDGTMLNTEMLKAGQARIDLSRGFAREKEFRAIEEQARSAGVGIWIK